MAILGKRTRLSNAAEEPACIQTRKRARLSRSVIHIEDESNLPSPESEDVQSMGLDLPLQDTRTLSGSSLASNRRPEIGGRRRTPNQKSHDHTPLCLNDENIPPAEFKTPSAIRFKDALAPSTPKHRVKIAGRPLTPRTPRTHEKTPSKAGTVYAIARQAFSQASSPTKLIGRDSERTELAQFISEAVVSRQGGGAYVSGPPGTGKSALVDEIVKKYSDKPNLKTSVINCVTLRSSKDVLRQITLDFCPELELASRAEKSALSNMFLPRKKSHLGSFLLVLDEVDNLLSFDAELLYDLFAWALHKSSRLILIGIANALDLTDRLLPHLKTKNLKPKLVPFMPYTASQIVSIVSEKLRSTLPADSSAAANFIPFVHPAAIQLCSKKVASQTGDLRKVFNLIRRAIDTVERETVEKHSGQIVTPTKQPFADITNTSPTKLPLSPPTSSPLKPTFPIHETGSINPTFSVETAPRATIAHVARVTAAVFNNGTVSRLSGLNLQQKAVLCTLIAAETKRRDRDPIRTPSKNAHKKPMVKDLFGSYAMLCKRDNVLIPLASTEFRDVVAGLETLGLVQEAGTRASFLTPTKTPSRLGRTLPEEKQFMSTVSEKELEASLHGAGADILKNLLHGQ